MYSNTKRYSESGWTKNIRSLLDKHFYTIQMQNREIKRWKKSSRDFSKTLAERILGHPALHCEPQDCQDHLVRLAMNFQIFLTTDLQHLETNISLACSRSVNKTVLTQNCSFFIAIRSSTAGKSILKDCDLFDNLLKKKKGSLDFCK